MQRYLLLVCRLLSAFLSSILQKNNLDFRKTFLFLSVEKIIFSFCKIGLCQTAHNHIFSTNCV